MMHAICLLDSPDAVAAMSGFDDGPVVTGIYRIKLARDAWELRGYSALRRAVFCKEQGLFDDCDEDAHDASAIPIVAVSYAAVMEDDVVGGVRIYQQSPGVWIGSRLAVDRNWRGVAGLASTLIRSAVCTAGGFGCHTFLANVQRANVPLFRRLRWKSLGEIELCGMPHQRMQADLAFYPPAPRIAPAPAFGEIHSWH